MSRGKRMLVVGGVVTGVAGLLHIGIIIGGPAWYRFFGAGEDMARMAARGRAFPGVVTAGIAAVLGVWMLYAFAGAGLIRRLPYMRLALSLIATVFLTRGVLGVPFVLLVDDPYARELRSRMPFMIVTSAIFIALGVFYAVGAASMSRSAVARQMLTGDQPT